MRIKRVRNGFTLIEILIVVLIIGLVYSIVLPFTQKTYEKFIIIKRIEEIKSFIAECKARSFLYGEKIEIHVENDSLRAGDLLFYRADLNLSSERPIVFYPLGTTGGGKIQVRYRDLFYELEILSPNGDIIVHK